MEDCIIRLTERLAGVEADTLEANKSRKKLEVALELCEAHRQLGMQRGVVKFADVALEADARSVPAHVAKCVALQELWRAAPSDPSRAAQPMLLARHKNAFSFLATRGGPTN